MRALHEHTSPDQLGPAGAQMIATNETPHYPRREDDVPAVIPNSYDAVVARRAIRADPAPDLQRLHAAV